MRNLKKILALVLALVMSLSLMATASATDFKDDDQFNPDYKTAAEVLEGLGVLKGDPDGSFRPTGSITRAEAAAAVYRIVTGDVEDKQVKIYEDYNIFTDVKTGDWYAGYVNFCANAEYIKGNGDGTFSPNEEVTGYAALAMILRAIGYTANGGFTGDDWHIQAARTAESRNITKNIFTGTLGAYATRETVAEILFQAILVNMVDHNQDNTYNGSQGYFETNMTLGYKTFKLEENEGVVVGNEFADLNSNQVLPEGKTALQVVGEDAPRILDVTSLLTDIGESRLVYTQDTSKVLSLADTGKNKITQFGHACDISTTAKFNATAEMPASAGIEYYVNFDRVGNYTCDQRLEFVVTFTLADGNGNAYIPGTNNRYTALTEIIADFEQAYTGGASLTATVANGGVGMTRISGTETGTTVTYSKVIRAESDISDLDLAVIRGIFVAADNNNDTDTRFEGVEGDVFVGTYSNGTGVGTTADERDLSNRISYKKFFEDYINAEVFDKNWDDSQNGWWVKFVDYDNDGQCDYAFCTYAFLDEALSTYTNKAGDTVMEYNRFNDDDHTDRNNDYTVRYMNDAEPVERDVTVGDKVIAALIDNQYLVGHANSVTKTVNKYDWKNDVITTTDGDEYGQSLIGNATDMLELISTMDEKTEYIMYLDSFGYVRAYELPGGTKYALVTELYYKNDNNGNLVQNWPMTVELWNGADGKGEYSTAAGSVFNARTNGTAAMQTPWTEVRSIAANRQYYNWLQPAISHLGVTRTGGNPAYAPTRVTPTFAAPQYTFWDKNFQLVNPITSLNGSGEFDYGTATRTKASVTNSPVTTSFTNVAIANINGESATIQGAAQLKLDNRGNPMWFDLVGGTAGVHDAGEPWRYAVDYVQLSTADIAAKSVRYAIGGSDAYKSLNNYYVNAVHDTEYYIVYNGNVLYVTDYANFPGLTNKDNNIRAAYAVARDTSADEANQPYWVADVIVYEIERYEDLSLSSISLVYYNPSRSTGNVQLLDTLNNKAEGTVVGVVPTPDPWGADKGSFGNYAGYGFYELYNAEALEDGTLAAEDIEPITEKFNDSGIFAGKIVRVNRLATGGAYIDVNTTGKYMIGRPAATRDGDAEWDWYNPAPSGDTLETNASITLNNNIYSITNENVLGSSNQDGWNVATPLQYSSSTLSQVKAGDRIIWVGAGKGTGVSTANFIVDLGHFDGENTSSTEIYDTTAAFLGARNAYRGDMDPNWANTPTNVNPDAPYGLPLWTIIWNDQNTVTPVVNDTKAPASVTITTSKGTLTKAVPTAAPYTVEVTYAEWMKLGAGETPEYTFTPAKDNTITAIGQTYTDAKKGETVKANGTVAIATNANQTFDVVSIGSTDKAVAKDFIVTITYKPQAGTFGDLYSKDERYVQVSTQTAVDGDCPPVALPEAIAPTAGAVSDEQIVVGNMSLAINTIVNNLGVKGCTITEWRAYDPAGTDVTATAQTILGATWLKLTVKNAANEVEEMWVYRADVDDMASAGDTGYWGTPKFTVTIGEGIKVFDGTTPWNAADFTQVQGNLSGKFNTTTRELTLDYDNGTTYTLVAEGMGTWNFDPANSCYKTEDGKLAGCSIAYPVFNAEGTVTFTKDENTLTVVCGANADDTTASSGKALVKYYDDSLPLIYKKGDVIDLEIIPDTTDSIIGATWNNGTKSGKLEHFSGNIWRIPAEVTQTMTAGDVYINVQISTNARDLKITNNTGMTVKVTYYNLAQDKYLEKIIASDDTTQNTTAINTLGTVTIEVIGTPTILVNATGTPPVSQAVVNAPNAKITGNIWESGRITGSTDVVITLTVPAT